MEIFVWKWQLQEWSRGVGCFLPLWKINISLWDILWDLRTCKVGYNLYVSHNSKWNLRVNCWYGLACDGLLIFHVSCEENQLWCSLCLIWVPNEATTLPVTLSSCSEGGLAFKTLASSCRNPQSSKSARFSRGPAWCSAIPVFRAGLQVYFGVEGMLRLPINLSASLAYTQCHLIPCCCSAQPPLASPP